MLKLKPLFKKFGFSALVAECKKEGWSIPSIADLRGKTNLEHNGSWVSDIPEKEEDRETHAMYYVIAEDKTILVNKSFMEPCIVWKDYNETITHCPHCGHAIID